MEGEWIGVSEWVQTDSGMYACCGDVACLRQHIVEAHGELLARVCGADATLTRSYCYHLEAIAEREQQHMPRAGPSIDRRSFQHLKGDLSEEAVKEPAEEPPHDPAQSLATVEVEVPSTGSGGGARPGSSRR